MTSNSTPLHSLRRVFNEGFSVHDIAEPLVSFDATATTSEVRSHMDDMGYEVVGVRDKGVVVGYLNKQDLVTGRCGDSIKPFEDSLVVADVTPLPEVVLRLKESPRLFISLLGRVGGIVTRTDLQKPPVRMWLFGMVTLLEMRFTRLIDLCCPDDTWQQFLSDGRVHKARDLLAERTRRNQQISLLDCLQFSDKGQIVARSKQLRELSRFESRRQIEDAFKRLEKLRNNLAHSQDIISGDWEIIVLLSENLDEVLHGPPILREEDTT